MNNCTKCVHYQVCDHKNLNLGPCILYENPRPHGEWRDFSEDGYVECPFCEHATTCDDNIDELHFCFFCGAELGKRGDLNE